MVLEKKIEYKGMKMGIKLYIGDNTCKCEIQVENGENYKYTRIMECISLIDIVKTSVRQAYLSQKQLEEFNDWDGIVED